MCRIQHIVIMQINSQEVRYACHLSYVSAESIKNQASNMEMQQMLSS